MQNICRYSYIYPNMALVFRGSVYSGSHIRESQHAAETSSQAQVNQFNVNSGGPVREKGTNFLMIPLVFYIKLLELIR
jgi:hypothetical protein